MFSGFDESISLLMSKHTEREFVMVVTSVVMDQTILIDLQTSQVNIWVNFI